MSLPKWIPRQYRELMVSFRAATAEDDPDDVMVFSQQQTEAQLQEQLGDDKIRAVRLIAAKITDKENAIKKSKGEHKRVLKQQLENLEQEQFLLLRDEILSACKNKYGLLDEEKLRKVKGSSVFFRNKEKINRKLNEGRNK